MKWPESNLESVCHFGFEFNAIPGTGFQMWSDCALVFRCGAVEEVLILIFDLPVIRNALLVQHIFPLAAKEDALDGVMIRACRIPTSFTREGLTVFYPDPLDPREVSLPVAADFADPPGP